MTARAQGETRDGRTVEARCAKCLVWLIDGVWQQYSATDVLGGVPLKMCPECDEKLGSDTITGALYPVGIRRFPRDSR